MAADHDRRQRDRAGAGHREADWVGQGHGPVRLATFAVSLLTAISATVEAFFRAREPWRHHRRTAELLKTEGWPFFQLTGDCRRYTAPAGGVSAVRQPRGGHPAAGRRCLYITTAAAEPT